jgi:hypothetical protein
MILDCLLGKVKVRCDFLVGQTFGNHRNDLLFPTSEAQLQPNVNGGKGQTFPRDVIEKRQAEPGRAKCLITGERLNSL